MSRAVVRDLREARSTAGPGELAAFETDVLAGFVLALAAAGLADATIRSDVTHLVAGDVISAASRLLVQPVRLCWRG